ncbi:MAG: ATP-binding cassette domain-containing protein [Phycisphaerae bacterium]
MVCRTWKHQWSARITSSHAHAAERCPEAAQLADMFGLDRPASGNGGSPASADGGRAASPGRPGSPIWEDFPLTLRAGEITAVVGPSGAGKSLFLRLAIRQLTVWRREWGVGCEEAKSFADPTPHSPRPTPYSPLSTPYVLCLDPSRFRRRPLAGRPPIALLKGGSLDRRLEVLSRCGLADAAVLVTPAKFLSGGELFRLAMAEALHRARRAGRAVIIVVDEFCSSLDSLTAANLCRQLRRLVSAWRLKPPTAIIRDWGPLPTGSPGLAMLLATPRVELLDALAPDQVIVKPLGGPPKIVDCGMRIADSQASMTSGKTGARGNPQSRRNLRSAIHNPQSPPGRPKPVGTWFVEEGRISDYGCLSRFHYIAGPPAAHKRVYVIRPPILLSSGPPFSPSSHLPVLPSLLTPRIAAVLVVSPPLMCVRGRNIATAGRYVRPDGRPDMPLLNAEMELISRVIVHPAYRGLGMAVALVRHALATARTPWMEALATMGRVNPFFERAGMTAWHAPPHGRPMKYVYYLARTGRFALLSGSNPSQSGRNGQLWAGSGSARQAAKRKSFDEKMLRSCSPRPNSGRQSPRAGQSTIRTPQSTIL